jgi:single-strand DNA-binding protein
MLLLMMKFLEEIYMSNYVNNVFLLGSSGKDPEIRTTGGGGTIATFSIATSEGRKDAQGNWSNETTWHNLKMFGRLAEIARDQVKKGSKVFVEGKITTESWDDKTTGQKRSKQVILANYLSVVPSARSASMDAEASGDQRPLTPRELVQQSTEVADADIPF